MGTDCPTFLKLWARRAQMTPLAGKELPLRKLTNPAERILGLWPGAARHSIKIALEIGPKSGPAGAKREKTAQKHLVLVESFR